ncbi:hypothetical protein CDIK_4474, partial [Cucumispora dikerogammari]
RKHYSQNTHPDHKIDTEISELRRNLEEVGNTNIRLKNMNNQNNTQRRSSLQFSKTELEEKNKIAVCSVKDETSCIKSQLNIKDGSSKLRYDVWNDKNKANYSITSPQTHKTYNNYTDSSSDNGVSNAKNLSIKEKIDRNYQNIYKNHNTPSLCKLRDEISKIKTIYNGKIQERKKCENAYKEENDRSFQKSSSLDEKQRKIKNISESETQNSKTVNEKQPARNTKTKEDVRNIHVFRFTENDCCFEDTLKTKNIISGEERVTVGEKTVDKKTGNITGETYRQFSENNKDQIKSLNIVDMSETEQVENK